MLTVEELQVILLSLRVAICCVVVTIPPALILGWILARYDFRLKLLLLHKQKVLILASFVFREYLTDSKSVHTVHQMEI